MEKTIILDAKGVSDNIQKIAEAILKKNPLGRDVVLVGIRTGGAFLAARLQRAIGTLEGSPPPLGIVDITLYRDDWTRMAPTPVVGKTDLPFSLDDKIVVLVDDVLFTGRTVRAAMDALIDYGRPKRIELAILADRGDNNRELPIMANYVGGVWDTAPDESINVYLEEEGFDDYVAIEKKDEAQKG
jgi:pyrimidine operon attenuation protein / uracil phosphoribosyltransferase